MPLVLLVAILVAGCSGAPASAPPSPALLAASHAPPGSAASSTRPAHPDDDDAGGEPSRAPTRTPTPTRPPTPRPTATATPQPTPAPTPRPEPFELNLYRRGDFVPQYTFDWCVAASVQMMLNMIREPNEGSRRRQGEIWDMARARSAFSRFGGANPVGWTAVLEELGAGDYELTSIKGYDDALQAAARAMRSTGRPVGLVMWTGRHAWVMNGFESIGDPGVHEEFRVTGIRVLDPLYPHGSRAWGPSPKPNSLLTPEELAEQFVTRTRNRPDYAVPGSYVLVLPV